MLKIDRQTWLRGEGGRESRLLRPCDGKMCCLGFAMLQAGYQEDHIRDVDDPSEICEWGRDIMGVLERSAYRDLLYNNQLSDLCTRIIIANDDRDMEPELRESRLRHLFGLLGVELEFIN